MAPTNTTKYKMVGKTLNYHGILWISGTHDDESGLNSTSRNAGDVALACGIKGSVFQHVKVACATDLQKYLKELAIEILYSRIFPIIHLDFHGSQDLGLKISQTDFLSWDDLFTSLRIINKIMGNSLVVVGAACEAYWALERLTSSFDKGSPMYLYIAPQKRVSIDFLDKNLQRFYLELLENGNSMKAAEILYPEFTLWHCERFLFVTICKYITNHCRGKTGRARAEDLLSQLLEMNADYSKINFYRKNIKRHLRPNQSLLDKYAKTFLCGDAISFSIEDIYRMIN